jgi:hypothetical protein
VTPPAGARFQALAAALADHRRTLRWVDYRQAEDDCALLARRLREELPADELGGLAAVAIPRGGFVVLGMLSYLLGLRPEQMTPSPAASGTVLVVDDCALSGVRFRHFVATLAGRRVVFAHLYSAPELRRAIAAAEPGVAHVLAAHDLPDRAPERLGGEGELAAWRERWRRRLGPGPYWIGDPAPVVFAWNEPDRPYWDAARDRLESGIHIASPARCLKNRARLGVLPDPRVPRRLEVPDGVATGDFPDGLWLCNAAGEVYSFAGAGAEMWRAIAALGNLEAVEELLADRFAVPRDELRRDLGEFSDELLARGLLAATAPAEPA